MLDFILYTQPKDKKPLFSKNEYSLNELFKAHGSSMLQELYEVVKQGTLKSVGEVGEFRCFTFICRYIKRHGPALVEVERPLDFWQSKTGALVISFGFPRNVARVGVALLSLAAFGDPMLIVPFPISKPDFLNLMRRVKQLGGTLTLVDIRKVSWGGGVLRHLTLKGRRLENIPGLVDVLEKTERINSLGFTFYGFRSIEKTLSFRVTDWGGGQIFSPPSPLSHERAELFKLLEESMLGTSC